MCADWAPDCVWGIPSRIHQQLPQETYEQWDVQISTWQDYSPPASVITNFLFYTLPMARNRSAQSAYVCSTTEYHIQGKTGLWGHVFKIRFSSLYKSEWKPQEFWLWLAAPGSATPAKNCRVLLEGPDQGGATHRALLSFSLLWPLKVVDEFHGN